MTPATRVSTQLDRAALATRVRAVLNQGRWGNADVLLVESDAGRVVVKDFGPRGPWVRRWIGPWLLRREERAYRRLEDFDAVPRLLGRLDGAALVFEYRPGVYLSRSLAGTLPSTFLPDLQAAVAEMHRRGIVHLDLRHRSNILAGADGRPVLLDFASALRFDATKRSGRILVGLLGWFDRRALRKWRARLA
jgi:serine/threonine protein kinase